MIFEYIFVIYDGNQLNTVLFVSGESPGIMLFYFMWSEN